MTFDPEFSLAALPRDTLAQLGRDYMLFAFLYTRVGLGYVQIDFGPDEREQMAILEWMGASPVYTQRMQRALGFFGSDDMGTIFKGLQLDVGFAHQYMDVAYQLIDDQHGEFWLNSCGALLDVEPMGEDLVFSMCHHIEDPTFDATAVATNPRARIRPIHRPPRAPADRSPHCHWTATIDPSVDPVIEDPLTARVRQSRLAGVDITLPPADGGGGLEDYSGAFEADFELEDLSHRALVAVLNEFAVQSHLLMRSMLLAVGDAHGQDAVRRLALVMAVGSNWVGSERVRRAIGADDDLDGLLRVLQVHPALPRDYCSPTFTVDGDTATITLDPRAPAFAEGDDASWFALLTAGDTSSVEALVQGVNPCAVVECTAPLTYRVAIDATAEPAAEPEAVQIARVGAVAGFVHIRPRAVSA